MRQTFVLIKLGQGQIRMISRWCSWWANDSPLLTIRLVSRRKIVEAEERNDTMVRTLWWGRIEEAGLGRQQVPGTGPNSE